MSFADLTEFTNTISAELYEIPYESNSFYSIGEQNGLLNLYRVGQDFPYIFISYTESGVIRTGSDPFYISRNASSLYGTFTLKSGTGLIIETSMELDNTISEIHGVVQMLPGTTIDVINSTEIIFYSDSELQVDLSNYYQNGGINPPITVSDDSVFKIYGEVNITLPSDESLDFETRLAAADSIINNPNIYIDSAAHINIALDLGERETSLTDYEYGLRSKTINIYTQGETNTHTGRVGYVWKGGNVHTHSQILQMVVLWGEVVLGDFKLSILGRQVDEVPNLQVLESIYVMKGTTLHVAERFTYDGVEYQYVRPELYLGRIINNCATPGHATIDGTLIADGSTALVTIDRGATLTIGKTGTIKIQNGARLRSAYNGDNPVLFINGTLIIDYIEQLVGFNANNIVFGENGKLVILNPTSDEYRLLWSTPNGIKTTQLYQLFENVLDHIEYHISKNTGIKIDQYYDFFGRDMTEWYNGIRIEKAIHEGQIVWHDGGCIELDSDVIPWVRTGCTLIEVSRLFKSYGSYDEDKLQEVVARLKYAGAGSIVFKFIDRNTDPDVTTTQVTLNLEGINVKSVVHKPDSNGSEVIVGGASMIIDDDNNNSLYEINTDNSGTLFIRNMTSDVDNVVNSNSKVRPLAKGTTTFNLN